MYRFLASTRWVGWLMLVIVFALVCAALSWWQWDRRSEVSSENRQVEANWDAAPVDLDTARPWLARLPEERAYTPVRLTGEYVADGTVFVRQRTLSSALGMEQLVPFRAEDGTVLIVDRGWLPLGDAADQRPDVIPAPPLGTITVTVRLKVGEPDIGRDAPEGQIASIDLGALAERTGLPVQTGAFGLLAAEDPAPATRPTALPKPEADEGMHWSYALQWAAFGVLFFVGFGYAARQQAKINRDEKAEAAEAAARGEEHVFRARRAPKAKAVRPRRDGKPHDEDVEDALLDAAEERSR